MRSVFHNTRRLLFCCVICVAQASDVAGQARSAQVKVEFRLAEIAPGPGLTPAKVDEALVVYLHKGVIITNKDIIAASASEEPNMLGQYEVRVVFTKKAVERMAKATEPKRRRSMLAILIDGKVVVAMGIPTRIFDKAIISGAMTKKRAENIAAMLTKGSAARRSI